MTLTLADLALIAAFWLLLACLRLRLRVDPRYRGTRRRRGRTLAAPMPLDPPTQSIDYEPNPVFARQLAGKDAT
jgi:hypothetical protein